MAQATLLGICSDTVVTIIQPSSTIECFDGVNPVDNKLVIEGSATFNDGITITGDSFSVDLFGNVDISGNLSVGQNTDIKGNLTVDQNTTLQGNLTVNGVVNAYPPAGCLVQYAGATAPPGWLLCQGQAIARSTYSLLFSVIGTQYGPGDSITTFNVPDMRSRIPIGVGQGAGLLNYTLNQTGGVETVTLDSTQIPAHTHQVSGTSTAAATGITATLPDHTHTFNDLTLNTSNRPTAYTAIPVDVGDMGIGSTKVESVTKGVNSLPINIPITDVGHTHGINITSQSTGSGLAHTNVQPYIALNYIIKY